MTKTTDHLDEIFSKALSNTIFKNHSALQMEFIPDHLPFRESQTTTIAQLLAPILRSSKPSNLLLYGKTGTGKTATTKHILNRLQTTCTQNNTSANFVYCNVKMAGTEYRVLAELASRIGLKIPFTGLAVTEVLSRIQQFMHQQSLHTILVLDELDFLIRNFGDDLLYNLTNSSDSIAPGFLSLIGISNDLQFKEELGARVQSRLSEEEVVFSPYSAAELKTILLERANIAFDPHAYTEAAVSLCAALSGSEHGDARRAVDLLRIAGEVAERESATQLEEKHVRIAIQKIDQDRVSEALKTLPIHAKLVLLASMTTESPHIDHQSSGGVYQKYVQLCTKSGLDALTTRRVSGLLTELDTLGLVSAVLVNYGRYGRTKKIVPKVSIATVESAFSEDETLQILSLA